MLSMDILRYDISRKLSIITPLSSRPRPCLSPSVLRVSDGTIRIHPNLHSFMDLLNLFRQQERPDYIPSCSAPGINQCILIFITNLEPRYTARFLELLDTLIVTKPYYLLFEPSRHERQISNPEADGSSYRWLR